MIKISITLKMHAPLSMIKSTGGYTQLLPLHMNVLNIMGDTLECLKN